MTEKDMCLNAISKGQLISFLKGEEGYKLYNHEVPLTTDYSRVLANGVYEAYKYDKKVKNCYQDSLLTMMESSDVGDLVHSYNYVRLQIVMEDNGYASFKLDEDVYKRLRVEIMKKKDLLCNYKKIPEYGSGLDNGAYDFINNMESISERDYGKRVL